MDSDPILQTKSKVGRGRYRHEHFCLYRVPLAAVPNSSIVGHHAAEAVQTEDQQAANRRSLAHRYGVPLRLLVLVLRQKSISV
jgi:hypothetical protein